MIGYYAVLDNDNNVVNVITGRNREEIVDGISNWESYYSEHLGCKVVETCINGSIRKNYATIGGKYDSVRDEFVNLQPFPSWTLTETNDWIAPETGQVLEDGVTYGWDEDNQRWFSIG
jgi:hypothetical protein